jgi:hypothetical protein
MKYLISWSERSQGSALEYENAQKRILGVFRHWEMPSTFKIELFVVCVGHWGGHILVETDDVVSIHRLCSAFPAFSFRVHPVLDIQSAVAAELEAIAWRDGLAAA